MNKKQLSIIFSLFILYLFSFSNEIIKDPFPIQAFLIFLYYIILFKNIKKIQKIPYFLMLIIVNFIHFIWLLDTIHFFGDINIVIAVFIIILIAIYLALYQYVFFIFAKKNINSKRIILIPVVFTLLEIIRGALFTGFTYKLTGYALYKIPILIYPSRFIGVYGVGFFIIIVSLLLARRLYYWNKRIFLIIILFYILLSGAVALKRKKIVYNGPNIALLETNFKPEDKRYDAFYVFKHFHLDSTKSFLNTINYKPDLVVWSETAVPFILNRNYYIEQLIKDFTKKYGISLIFGSEYIENSKIYNSSFFYKRGKLKGIYNKIHLVPFGEIFPFKNLWPFKLLYGEFTSFSRGKKVSLFSVKNIKIFTPICYEIAFNNINRKATKLGANVIINISNDGWYGYSSGPYDEMAFAVFRAIENNVYVMRSVNKGWGLIVDPRGNIIYKNNPTQTGFIIFTNKKIKFFPIKN